ncbi:hypothetical protein D1823_08825 [Ruegeria sp. AD91A]|uniref:hypothetical protein n=1 Tax=Ruegeria sp. AD91A TaxID=2293862 RepID=UPI000E47BA43|nr:hypothetical protein [Ruegeria sp. AD91A]AXT26675.1 hypothetical protein D1823_08825 [Ruegeria sp. AD91A]
MSQDPDIQTRIAETVVLLRAKIGVRDRTLEASIRKAKRRLPRRVYKQALFLARAEAMASHPKLRLVLDNPKLIKASDVVQDHLGSINLADRRWGWFLGLLGGLAFNMLALATLLLVFLGWRGLI